PPGAGRLRVRPRGDLRGVDVRRAAGRLAGRAGDGYEDGRGLGAAGPAVGGRPAVRRGGAGHAGLRQPEYARAGLAVPGIRAGRGAADREQAGVGPYAEARQLAQRGGAGTLGADATVPGPADRLPG